MAVMGFRDPQSLQQPTENPLLQKVLGGLLGQPQSYGGLLGVQDQKAAQRQAAMAMAAQLMSASGPSQTPVSFGQALGPALMAGQQAQQQHGQDMLQAMLLKTKLQQSKVAKTPSAVQEFEYAKANGFNGTFEEWKRVASAQPQEASAIAVHKYFESLTPEQQKAFLQTQRSPVLPQLAVVNGVPTLVDRTGAAPPQPLSTQESEVEAARQRKEAEAAGAAVGKVTGAREGKAPTAFAAYQSGVSALEKSMSETATGPIAGRIPAITAKQQTAEGAEATMAPILKQLFRDSGEGTFTDADQALLMKMVPTRKDHPEARKAKIEMIDGIVRAKLAIERSPQGSAMSGAPKRVRVDAQGNVVGN